MEEHKDSPITYNEQLTERIRKLLATLRHDGKKMFGGVSFPIGANMCCVVTKGDDSVLRLGPELIEQAIKKAHVTRCNFTGRPILLHLYQPNNAFAGPR